MDNLIDLRPLASPTWLLLAPAVIALLVCGFGISLLLSPPLNLLLSLRHAIYATDGTQRLPGCPYVWPNGQGDAAKFFYGKENSALWRQNYGSVYRIWSGTNPEVVISHPDDIRLVFRDSHHHAKAPANNAGRLMHELLGQCLGLISHADWSAVRAAVNSPFLAPRTATHLPTMVEEIRTHLATQLSDPSSNLAAGKLDPVGDLKFVPFWIVARILYGPLDAAARAELKELVPLRERLWGRMLQGGLVRFQWSRWMPWLEANQELREWKKRWASFNARMALSPATSSPGGDGSNDAPITQMYARVRRGDLTEEQLLQTIDEMLFANLDVTMGGVSWNFVFLAAHSEVQAQLRAELQANCPGLVNILRGNSQDTGAYEAYLLSDTTLLNACMLEASRLRPLAAFSVPQSAPTARGVGEHTHDGDGKKKTPSRTYQVPSGTSFVIDTHTLNLRDPFWGENEAARTAYRPKRWMQLARTEYRYRYWRFGFGPRQCLGRYVADAIIKSLMALLVHEFDLGPPLGEESAGWARDPTSWIMHPTVVLNCTRRNGAAEEHGWLSRPT